MCTFSQEANGLTNCSGSDTQVAPQHNDYEGLSDEELQELWEDTEADYWIELAKSEPNIY